jgi:hypothetical protein
MAKKYKYKLNQYPYIYQCHHCKDRFEEPFELGQDEERQIKEDNGVKSGLPIFFECDFCHDYDIRPIGYKGKPSFRLGDDGELEYVRRIWDKWHK